jgi:hypothetical protein
MRNRKDGGGHVLCKSGAARQFARTRTAPGESVTEEADSAGGLMRCEGLITRRLASPQFKAQVGLEVPSGQRSASESARQHKLVELKR